MANVVRALAVLTFGPIAFAFILHLLEVLPSAAHLCLFSERKCNYSGLLFDSMEDWLSPSDQCYVADTKV